MKDKEQPELGKTRSYAYSNIPEETFFKQALDTGWTVTKRGWPDFFLEKDGKIMCVEVKPDSRRPGRFREPSSHQSRIMRALAAHGIPCFVWTPSGGLRQI